MDQHLCYFCHKKADYQKFDWVSAGGGRYGHINCVTDCLLAEIREIRRWANEMLNKRPAQAA